MAVSKESNFTNDGNAADQRTPTAGDGRPSSPLLIALVWAVVVIPAGWGLNYTVQNALKIFTAPLPAAASPAQIPAANSTPSSPR